MEYFVSLQTNKKIKNEDTHGHREREREREIHK